MRASLPITAATLFTPVAGQPLLHFLFSAHCLSRVAGESTPSHLQAFSATFTHLPETAGEYPRCWDVSLEDALRCLLVTDVEMPQTLLFLGAFMCLAFARQSTQHLIPFAAIWQTYPWSPEKHR